MRRRWLSAMPKRPFQADPQNEDRKTLVDNLKKSLEDLDGLAPRISSDVAVEIALRGVPHG